MGYAEEIGKTQVIMVPSAVATKEEKYSSGATGICGGLFAQMFPNMTKETYGLH